jgi:hypothetical protein
MFTIYSILSILFFTILCLQTSFAFTYESQDWWFAPEQQNQISGNIGIIFTYPDKIIKNDTMDVDVRLEYMKNENTRSEYVVFDDIKIHIRDLDSRFDNDLIYSYNATSPILLPDGIFSNKFVIPTENINLQVEKSYAVDLSFTVMFGRKTTLETFYWDSGEYFGNSIEERELKPFKVVDVKKNNSERELTIRVNKPFGFLIPLNVIIDNNTYNMIEDVININSKNLTSNPYNSKSQNSSFETIHKIKVDSILPLLKQQDYPIIQARFVSWSDGNKNPEREIKLDKNKELFGFYKTQYYLNLTSENNYGKTNGTGYYDSGDVAQFSILDIDANKPKTFDHWKGDIDTNNDDTSTSNNIIMNGPKNIQAVWKDNSVFEIFSFITRNFPEFFYGFIAAAIIGPIIGWMLSITPAMIEKKRQLTYLKTYITLIDNIFTEYSNQKNNCMTFLEQKRKEIISLLQSGIINAETFRLLNEHIKNLIDEISK